MQHDHKTDKNKSEIHFKPWAREYIQNLSNQSKFKQVWASLDKSEQVQTSVCKVPFKSTQVSLQNFYNTDQNLEKWPKEQQQQQQQQQQTNSM